MYTALFTVLSYVDGEIYNGTRLLKHLCTVLYRNYVKIVILQDGYLNLWMKSSGKFLYIATIPYTMKGCINPSWCKHGVAICSIYNTVYRCINGLLPLYILPSTYDEAVKQCHMSFFF